jgi:hypothetical protein
MLAAPATADGAGADGAGVRVLPDAARLNPASLARSEPGRPLPGEHNVRHCK